MENIFRWKDQNKITDKFDNTIWRDKPKDIGERRETQKILGQDEEVKNNTGSLKKRKKILPLVSEECMRTNNQTDAKETKQLWS